MDGRREKRKEEYFSVEKKNKNKKRSRIKKIFLSGRNAIYVFEITTKVRAIMFNDHFVRCLSRDVSIIIAESCELR